MAKNSDGGKESGKVIHFPRRTNASAPVPKSELKTPAGESAAGYRNLAVGGAVLAILLATGAANRSTFNHNQGLVENRNGGRGLASASSPLIINRDAKWEKQLAERLVQKSGRQIASSQIGRVASLEDRLRWGPLEEKYTIYKEDAKRISAIFLQDPETSPAYILNRGKFLQQFGSLLTKDFDSAQLKAIETGPNNQVIEAYTIFDKQKQPCAVAHFELDQYSRLLSLNVKPNSL